MSNEIYVILHLIYMAAELISLLCCMWGFSWADKEPFDAMSLLSLVMPVIYSVSAIATAWAVGMTSPYTAKTVVLISDLAMFIVTIVVAALFSIKKYRDEGCEPNYAAFLIVAGYSFILTLCAVLFTYLS